MHLHLPHPLLIQAMLRRSGPREGEQSILLSRAEATLAGEGRAINKIRCILV